MHLRGLINGTLAEIMQWDSDIKAQFLNYPRRNGKNPFEGKMITGGIRLGVRYTLPVDLTFPKEQLEKVLNLTKPQITGNKIVNWIRKFMGLKKVEDWKKVPCLFDGIHAVQFHAIGLIDDTFRNGVEQI